ncbi:aminotransferase class IV [Corynebacterium aquilae]|uniref:Aminotransferase n=1 Tax=Corynebacterium aquilae DSM 44791 TaxID=1431546 RepID=A0A1L7CEP8_9CORY|nr:aminotransferase class IV [Corynebacterium aquilae]APT84297.1 hypothetical protein CAQU_03555 [Corynebacterium aquilae DSM 44791]
MSVTSFRMIDGRVRNFSAHLQRLRSYQPMSEAQEAQLRKELRKKGTFNVKITCDTGTFLVQHRPDRPVKDKIALWGHLQKDERINPTVKGPDLYWLAQLKNKAQTHGAHEALLVDERGHVIEAIHASVLALKDNTIHISDHPRALPPTMRPLVLNYLTDRFDIDVESHPEGLSPELVRSSEVLLTNSFHGVQQVTQLLEYATAQPRPTTLKVEAINRQLWAEAESVEPS